MSSGTQSFTIATVQPARSLAESWAYNPAWRSDLVESHVAELALTSDRRAALQERIFNERDPIIRQALRFRVSGRCAFQDQIAWSYRAFHENDRAGAITALRAMVIAGVPESEIAKELHTTRANVILAERLFWAVRPYLRDRMWLRSIAAPEYQERATTLAQSRERVWLRVAFEEGWEGLRGLIHGETGADAGTLDEIASKIEAIAARRTLAFTRQLEADGTAPGVGDLNLYTAVRAMRSRHSTQTAVDQNEKVRNWVKGVVDMLMTPKNVEPYPFDPKFYSHFTPEERAALPWWDEEMRKYKEHQAKLEAQAK